MAADRRLLLEIDIGELLPVVVAHNKARFLFLSGRREAAGWHLLRFVGALVVLLFGGKLKRLGSQFSASVLYLFNERGQSWGHLLICPIVLSH